MAGKSSNLPHPSIISHTMAVRLVRATAAFSIATLNCRSSAFSPLQLTPKTPYNPSIHHKQAKARDFLRFVMAASSALEEDKADVSSNIESVRQRIQDAMYANNRSDGSVRLVAVSKTKPLELLVAAYEVRRKISRLQCCLWNELMHSYFNHVF